jgi:hypothetical protein
MLEDGGAQQVEATPAAASKFDHIARVIYMTHELTGIEPNCSTKSLLVPFVYISVISMIWNWRIVLVA